MSTKALLPSPPTLEPAPGTKAKLDRTDPIGWYMCKVGENWRVLHWDGNELDDTVPHYCMAFTRRMYKDAYDFRGPMVFVDIDFP